MFLGMGLLLQDDLKIQLLEYINFNLEFSDHLYL
jgi:hypothetical protein